MKTFSVVVIVALVSFALCGGSEPRYAVSILYPNNSTVSGLIAFQQNGEEHLTEVRATVRGLAPLTKHGIHIHSFGDLTEGCASTSTHYNPFNKTHGDITGSNRHVGDLSNIMSDINGNVYMTLVTSRLTLFGELSIVGRAVVVHAQVDDLGMGGND